MAEFSEGPSWQKIVAVILIVASIGWGLYSFFYKPRIKELGEFKRALNLAQREIELRQPTKAVIEKGALFTEEIRRLEKKIPTEAEVPMLLKEFIFEAGKGLNIQYELFQPQTIVSEEKYKRVPLKLDLSCSYSDLNLYLMQIENLPAVIRVDELKIKKEKEHRLKVHLGLSAFVMPGGKIAEEAKEEEKVKKEVAYAFVYDPFYPAKPEISLPVGLKGVGPWDLQFKGVWRGKTVKAFINDDVYGKGEWVKGYKVIDIKDNKVVVAKKGRVYTLRLEGE